jgi:hypothetical protein
VPRGINDLGGMPAGPLDLHEHERTFFDQRVDAMLRLLAHPERGHFTVDAMRRAIESLPPAEYFGLSYYEKWLRALRQLTVEKGLLSERQLQERMTALSGESVQR